MFTWILAALAESDQQTAQPGWFATAFKKLVNAPGWALTLLAALLVCGLVVFFLARGKKKTVWTTKMLSLGAICMALSSVLSMIRLMKMPQGGSVTPASMLPLMLFAYIYGAGPGVTLGAIYGLLQYILDPFFVSLPQMMLDYPIAFAMMGLAGLTRNWQKTTLGLPLGILLASCARFIAALLSGVAFFASYAEGTGLSPLMYSASYNGSYMLPETVICIVLSLLAGPVLVRELRKQSHTHGAN